MYVTDWADDGEAEKPKMMRQYPQEVSTGSARIGGTNETML